MTTRKTPTQKLSELEKKKSQINARIQKERAKLRGQLRKQDTRRKIIAGALALEHMKQDKVFGKKLTKLLDEYVTRNEDRKLFELPELKKLDE